MNVGECLFDNFRCFAHLAGMCAEGQPAAVNGHLSAPAQSVERKNKCVLAHYARLRSRPPRKDKVSAWDVRARPWHHFQLMA